MCGIVGLVDSRFKADADSVRAAAEMLAKRGPDDSGVWTADNVGLGHRRLSIIDLSPSGHQPMCSEDGRYVIVFNGEIYNFKEIKRQLGDGEIHWQSHSDTEVILAAYARWGTSCVERFHGMFAFAIWDRQDKVLYAARDRMGEKPFFYHFSDKGFAFASRPRALFGLLPELSSELDLQALRYYVEGGYVPTPLSIFSAVRKLPPAHWLRLKSGELHIERYWDFRQIMPERSWEERKEEDLLDELEEVVSRCVRLRMVSDLPVGAFLSGGIDSSVVAAIMAKLSSKPIKTFTIGFEQSRYDESPHALAVAKSIGSDHFCERVQVEDLLELMPTYFLEYDEPFADSSAFPTLAVSRAARQHVTVSLSGDGGDELFGGYAYYRMVDRLETLFKLPAKARGWIAGIAGIVPRHRFKLLSAALRKESPAEVFCFARSFTKDFGNVFSPALLNNTGSLRELLLETVASLPRGLKAAEQAMRMDAFCTLNDDYLQKVDVGSMAFSLESRGPLLDQDLVEWAMRLPLKWKLRGRHNKYLFRKLAHRYAPKRILDRPKHGFEIPLAEWLRGTLHGWADKQFRDKTIFAGILLQREKLGELLELHRCGARNAHPLLWATLVLLQFSIRYGNSSSVALRNAVERHSTVGAA
jgi:asparagine synthase (glutamine-hydrolysing)